MDDQKDVVLPEGEEGAAPEMPVTDAPAADAEVTPEGGEAEAA